MKELKARDLRIGNFVEITEKAAGHVIDTCHVPEGFSMDNRIHRVGKIDNECIDLIVCEEYFEFYPEDIVGIPLTEEWLKRFGLFKPYDQFYWTFNHHKLNQFKLHWKEGKKEWYVTWDGAFIGYRKYVHELQNLFFSLTGEELKAK